MSMPLGIEGGVLAADICMPGMSAMAPALGAGRAGFESAIFMVPISPAGALAGAWGAVA